MDDKPLAKALKDLPLRVQSASYVERIQVFKALNDAFSDTSSDVSEGVIKGVCRVLIFTLPRYHKNSSRKLVQDFILTLLKHHNAATVQHLSNTLAVYSTAYKNLASSDTLAKELLAAFDWSYKVLVHGFKDASNCKGVSFQKLVEAQSCLYTSILASRSKKMSAKAYHKLVQGWKQIPGSEVKYWEALCELETSFQSLVLSCAVLSFVQANKNAELLSSMRRSLLDSFIKVAITTKVKPDTYFVEQCKPFLKLLTHDDFKGLLLPALLKAMLRSPEIILGCVGQVLASVSIDLSAYAADLAKPIATCLHSKEDLTREEAAFATEALAKQCSEATAVRNLLNLLFGVLQGSEGKLTLSSHKISILEGIGHLSKHCVTGKGAHQLSCDAAEHFVKILETEVHEGTLIRALSSLLLWANRFAAAIPKTLMEMFKKGMTLKTSTPAVRTGYIRCMAASLHGESLPQGIELIPVLLKSLERAAAQPTQAAIVSEGLSAATLLLRCASLDEKAASQCGPLWTILSDTDKLLFVNEKMLSSYNEETWLEVVLLCESLFVTHEQRIGDKAAPYFRAIILALTRPNFSLRTRAASAVKKILPPTVKTTLDRSLALIAEFTIFLHTAKVVSGIRNREEGDTTGVLSATLNETDANSLIFCLQTITSLKGRSQENYNKLAVACFKAAHHPAIASVQPLCWYYIVKHFGQVPKALVSRCYAQLKEELIKNHKPGSWPEASLSGLMKLAPEETIKDVLDAISATLSQEELLRVTRDDYFTFLTPEGELYDRSVLENAKEEAARNIKRESRAYSYKEQMEELQLIRELEEKRIREGKKKAPEMSPKQKEAIRVQLEKESAIRSKVAALDVVVRQVCSMLKSAIDNVPGVLSNQLTQLIPWMMRAMGSPVAAPLLQPLWIDLRKSVFEADMELLAKSIAHVSLRLVKPMCDLDPAWETESLDDASRRVLKQLVGATATPLNAPTFTYCFPFIRGTLKQLSSKEEALAAQGIQLIERHAGLRSVGQPGQTYPQNNPRLLPLKEMMDLLIHLIGTTTGREQQTAYSALLEVAASASGKAGCAVATDEEVNCLLDSLESSVDSVRDACLHSLSVLLPVLTRNRVKTFTTHLNHRLWVAKFDVVPEIREKGEQLWAATQLQPVKNMFELVLEDVTHMVEPIRAAGAEALASALQLNTAEVDPTAKRLIKLYGERLELTPAVKDNFGRELQPPMDVWEPRAGIGLALYRLVPLMDDTTVVRLASFFVPKGLGDREESVKKTMLNAAVTMVDQHGKETITKLLPVFEKFMDDAPKSGSFDSVRQSVVILMGSLARHLEKEDPRVKPIIYKLVDALSTPSQPVQEAVANCLPPLVPAIKDEVAPLVQRLLQKLLSSNNYGDRKGAAYGIAGIVKGLGILSLKQLDIMTSLTEAIQNKKNIRHREGALFAFEQLCSMLGRLFEPYVVHVLPHLLLCFGDTNQFVREAADDTAKAVMSKLSAHGVKLVLPSLLAALEQDSWRTKTGSVELLGAMAYCAPRQLSSCLPGIVPKLIEVLGDSHVKVQAAGAQALQIIGSVIRNPEIQAIVPVLLEALQDPAKKTSSCLATLLETKFVHFIDAPSLALIMPVVQRAFQDRSTETRKMAAQIIGNMYSLTDQKDLSPYLSTIIPGLKASLLDPVPDVRSVSARALGAMVRGMGEASFDDLLPWLMQTLTSESSSVDRSGAAQGLSEVVGGLGVDKLHKLMPEIIATAERQDIAPHVKDGYITMFIYLPGVFQNEFTPYISQIIPSILKALADENEFVRDTALRAGQRIVNMYADTAIMLLLPELELGLFDDNWRIRYSSIQLLGDLLYKISGVSGKMTTETASEDDNFGTEQSHRAIMDTLGTERRNRVLAGLYMGRSDVALLVRQAALHVWKVVVTNTPRTLREILSTLFNLLLGCLASSVYDKRQVAARTLGDLVRKLGERVLPEIIPILEDGLNSDEPDTRQGVCIGLSEIMASTSREMVMTFVDSLVPTVRKALCDPLSEVRQAAAKTFDSLHSTVGGRALDDILPFMLEALNDPDQGENALDGLRQVMAIKPRVVLPYLIPHLTAPPVNTKALSVLASVAGDALARHFNRLLPALLAAVTAAAGTPAEAQEVEYCQVVLLSVQDEQGIRAIMDELLTSTKSDKLPLRRAAVSLLAGFCTHTKADYIQYVPQLLRGLIHLLTDNDPGVLNPALEALNSVIKTLDATQQMAHVGDLRQAVRFAMSDLKGQEFLPGCCLSKGIAPLLPVYREAILNGPPEMKEQAAQGLGELIKLTSPEALKPSVVAITGPLIRILGDRFSAGVKVAVLETLALLLAKVGALLKPFLPQLQTTFVKSLSDPNRQVRLKAATALSHLIVIHTRADPLFNELYTSIKTTDDSSIRETSLQALRGVITPAGDKMSEPIRKSILATLQSMLSHPEDTTRSAAAGCLGALFRRLPADELEALVNECLLHDDPSLDWTLRHGKSAVLSVALKEAAEQVYTAEWRDKLHRVLLSYLTADRIPIVSNSIRAIGFLFRHLMTTTSPVSFPAQLSQPFAKTLNHASNEVKQLVAQTSHYLGRHIDTALPSDFLKVLLPQLVNGTKEKNTAVRSACEAALVTILRLRHNDETQQHCVNLLDPGARDSLSEVISKVLRKMASLPETKEEELDATLVS
ncbi:stalled ribosome sensor GCN1-like [Daphnia carinata]|uniref:stalled ribosome sensor GCN1-like n=1 Tax=Daphnia carinata TaxID=120202 RepID=UPI00257AE456|nr:stalled ribosome sensor GCN1-like [Daphnia carinata]